jgi:ankyrin repeat protein
MIRRMSFVNILIVVFTLSGCAGILAPSHHSPEQYSAVFAAASAGDMPTLRRDLEVDPHLLTATEWEGRRLLHDAADKSQLDAVRYLLDLGANINAVTTDGRTALHMAAQRGDIAMITLLRRGAPTFTNPMLRAGLLLIVPSSGAAKMLRRCYDRHLPSFRVCFSSNSIISSDRCRDG